MSKGLAVLCNLGGNSHKNMTNDATLDNKRGSQESRLLRGKHRLLISSCSEQTCLAQFANDFTTFFQEKTACRPARLQFDRFDMTV